MNNIETDYIGMMFGRWTIIGDYIRTSKYGHRKYLCKCSCEKGTERYVDIQNLKSGKSVSCGCLTVEVVKNHFTTHGETKTRLHKIWCNMRSRCNNPNVNCYKNYGGRGIRVCDEWSSSYEAFRNWALSHGYRDNLTIDRIDNDGNYEPSNCRWVDNKTQCNNRRSNVLLEMNGIKKNATEWGVELGIKPSVIQARVRSGITNEQIFSKDRLNKIITIEHNGEIHTISEWSKITGINRATIWYRYNKGLTTNEILFKGNLCYGNGG